MRLLFFPLVVGTSLLVSGALGAVQGASSVSHSSAGSAYGNNQAIMHADIFTGHRWLQGEGGNGTASNETTTPAPGGDENQAVPTWLADFEPTCDSTVEAEGKVTCEINQTSVQITVTCDSDEEAGTPDIFASAQNCVCNANVTSEDGSVRMCTCGVCPTGSFSFDCSKSDAEDVALSEGECISVDCDGQCIIGTVDNSTETDSEGGGNIFDHNNGGSSNTNGTTPSPSPSGNVTLSGNTTDESGNTTSPSSQNSTQGKQGFLNAGELRVALDQYFNNETEEVVAQYGEISDWNVSLVDDFVGLFRNQVDFNEDISKWQTGSVTDMSQIFLNATKFNGVLTTWDTTKVTAMTSAFQGASAFNTDITTWNTSMVTTMADMFRAASSFNVDINFWNVDEVKDFSTMFWEATSFNMNLSSWNVIRAQDLSGMFRNATSFSQKLCWKLRENANVQVMFCDSNGGGFQEDCICSHDLYYDETCVRPSVVAEAICDPDFAKSAAATTVFGMVLAQPSSWIWWWTCTTGTAVALVGALFI